MNHRTLLFAVSCLLASAAQAQFVAAPELKPYALETPASKEIAHRLPPPAACRSCGADMRGNWTYNRHDDNNLDINGPLPIGFEQHGAWFWGGNDRHTIIGEVRGKWIKVTITVAGEEGMGWVSMGEGTIHAYDELGGFVLATLVTRDTFGRSGSLILRRAP